MTYLLATTVAIAAGWGIRRYVGPRCPRCRHRNWDHRLCAPLLLCRRCATRIDVHGRTFN
jgi:hypothetical protein